MNKEINQPNILLIMPDQMRGDCLSLEHHPVLITPNIDEIGGQGAHFTKAYTTCASCIPARRSLLTGQFPATNGMVGFVGGHPIKSDTLPQLLKDNGYATALIGRNMHQHPYEEGYGFEKQILGSTYIEDDEYSKALDKAIPELGGIRGLGISCNGWQAKPWTYPEHLHPTNWVVKQSRDHIKEIGGNQPQLLVTSFYAPHPPLIPPEYYMNRYLSQDLPEPAIGQWEEPPPNNALGLGVNSNRTVLKGEALKAAQAGYFGLINQIDDQIYWMVREFKDMSIKAKRPWIILFTTDHGEMMGDHYYFRKCEPYEGSSRIPFLIQGSDQLGFKKGLTNDTPVCLEDIMPTLLELAEIEISNNIDGKSLVSLLRGEAEEVRQYLHAEHSPCYSDEQAYHFITDGEFKFIWRPFEGIEQLFNLKSDPNELINLTADEKHEKKLTELRTQLIKTLKNRPEGFTNGSELIANQKYPGVLPGY
ncbi:MAG: hypothetical protein COA79_01630 [Planctomycetota bacterium]|nr:MAG: hypothetical protein COA79_01630 [Planctomycetota bacterium]